MGSILHTMEQSDSLLHVMEQNDSILHAMEQTPPNNKRVTWDSNLCEIRMISPRENKKVFPLPASHHEDISKQQINQITQPSELRTQPGMCLTKFYLPNKNKSLDLCKLGCSEQLQTVVDRARARTQISNNNDKMGYTRQPDRSKLKLHFENPL